MIPEGWILQVEPESIRVPERQRKDYGDLEPLKGSLETIGQLQPIIVIGAGDDLCLLAGGRRLQSIIELGWPRIEAKVYQMDLSATTRALIELEENIKRKQLDWREEVLACTNLHDAHCANDESWNVSNTADILNIGGRTASRYLSVGRALAEGDEQVLACQSVAAAAAAITRKMQRNVDDEAAVLLDNVNITIGEDYGVTSVPRAPEKSDAARSDEFKSIRSAKHDVHLVDFTKWAPQYDGPPFQVIHLDPPYGIMHHESEQGGGEVHGTYRDEEDDFWNILIALRDNRRRLIAQRAHIILWYSMKFYRELVTSFSITEWNDAVVNPFPLIWHKKDNIGLVPDAKRYGRRVYETALLISVGDRQINTVRPNLFSWESGKARAQHLSEKPEAVVDYFLSWVMHFERKVHFLDPTCGSGNALSAAERLGALSVTGLDIDEVCVETSRRTLNARRLREIGRGSDVEGMTNNQLNSAGE